MAVAALIKFVQGALTPPAGEALIGLLDTLTTASNGNNANVERWEWEWFATPTGSALPRGIIVSGSVPTTSFTPDVRGTYVLVLRVYDRVGNVSQDMRCFAVLEENGQLIPNFGADQSALNFDGQELGWHPYVEAWFKNRVVLATTDATVTRIKRYPIADGQLRLIRQILKVESADSSAAVLGEWEIKGAYAVTAGTLAQAYAPTITAVFTVGAPGLPTIALNGDTDVDINVTGIAATNLVWTLSEFSL